MYVVTAPSSQYAKYEEFVFRFKTNDGSRSASLRMPAKRRQLSLPGSIAEFLDKRTKVWITTTSEKSVIELTPRVSVGVGERVSDFSIPSLFAKIDGPTDSRLKQALEVIEVCRIITSDRARNYIRALSQSLHLRGLVNYLDTKGTLIHHIIEAYSDRRFNDGTEILDTLFYIYYYNKLHLATKGSSWESYLHNNGFIPEVRDRLLVILDELTMRDSFPLCSTLRIGLEETLFSREIAENTAHKLRSDVELEPRLQGEVGALSYGVPGIPQNDITPTFEGLFGYNFTANSDRITILYSGDIKFIAAYAPRLLFFANLFPELDFHINVIGNKAETTSLCSKLVSLMEQIQNLRGDLSNKNISYSITPVPNGVDALIPYYASVRFYFAHQFLKNYRQGLWIHDVDLYPEGDISRYVKYFSNYDLALVVSGLHSGICPWKRYLAGNIFFQPTEASAEVLQRTTNYLSYWLQENPSWMIDQNALAWGFDGVKDIRIRNLRPLFLPLKQSVLAGRIESR